MNLTMPEDFHSVKVTHITEGYQGTCTCGWRGSVVIRLDGDSGRRAFVKARDESESHWQEVQRRRAVQPEPQR